MPRYDGTGPAGGGPRTGRGLGPCPPEKEDKKTPATPPRPPASPAGRRSGQAPRGGLGLGLGRSAGRGAGRGLRRAR